MSTKFFSVSDIEQTILPCPLRLTAATPVIEAVQLMSQFNDTCHLTSVLLQSDVNLVKHSEQASCVLVVENNKLVGIFTERDIVKYTATGLNLEAATLADVMTENPVILKKSQFTNIFIVLNLFRQYNIRHVAVVDDQDDVIGLVTPTTVRQLLQASDLLKMRSVDEVMTKEVIQARPTATVLELAQLMTENAVSCVVITQSESQPIGMVTERDIVQIRALELDIRNIQANVVMSAPLFYMRQEQSLWEAHQQMQQRRIRRLVVVGDRNELRGIVTQTSVLYSLDPLKMYETVNLLQQTVCTLEAEKVEILEKQNIELERQVEERTAKLIQQANSDRLLANLSQQIRQSFDLDLILHTTVSEIRGYLQTDRVVIYQFESESTGRIVAESLAPTKTSIVSRVIHDPCLETNWIDHYTNGNVLRIDDIYTYGLANSHIELLEQAEIRAYLIVPIVYNQQLWGLLCAHQCFQPRFWESVEVKLLEKLSNHIAIAIQQSQLYQQAQKELQERQQAEIELKKLNEELESRVAERTAELERINQHLRLEILERKRAESALKESEQKFRQLAENLQQVFWMTDPEQSQMVYISPAYEQIWGRSCTSLYENPNSFMEAIYTDDITQVLAVIKNKKQGFDLEYRIIRPDGSMRWIRDQAFPLKDETGEVYRVVGIAEDITKSKAAAVALERSQNFLRQVIDTNPNLIFVKDLQGRFVLANQALADIYGTTVEELIGKTEADFNSNPRELEDLQLINQQVMITLQPHTINETIIITATGEIRYFQTIKSPLLAPDGKAYQILGVLTDITERKQAEQEISKALEREKELGELKSRFVSMTSHEFRTPLAVISSSAGILKDFAHKLDDKKKKKHLDCIQTYVKHTTQLLDDILLINKAETGKLAFEPAPLHVIDFSQQLTEEIQLSAPNHKIVFSSNYQTGVIVNLDKKLLRQILINLLSNAIKYSPNSATVNFNLNITESNLIFSIQDEGIGIPETDQVKLFESFHRAKNVGNIPGTGLGLSIVAKCVELHKGSITVNSAVGMGTTFMVNIPLESITFLPEFVNNTDNFLS